MKRWALTYEAEYGVARDTGLRFRTQWGADRAATRANEILALGPRRKASTSAYPRFDRYWLNTRGQ